MMFSRWLLARPIAKNPAALERIGVAKFRILSILDRETVAHEKTLEQKIADQGPFAQRVDPHLISLAIDDMRELKRISVHHHPATTHTPWYANLGTALDAVAKRLDILAPLYDQVSNQLSNVIGDALEVATFRALEHVRLTKPRYHFEGRFFLDRPKNEHARFQQRKAPKEVGQHATDKQPDFLQYGHDAESWPHPSAQFSRFLE